MVWCGMEVCHFALPLQQIVRQLLMHTRQQRCLECVFQYRWKSVRWEMTLGFVAPSR